MTPNTAGPRGDGLRSTAWLRPLGVGRLRGVPIYLAPSWLLIALLLCVTYTPIVRDAVGDIGTGAAALTALAYAVLFALCVLAHELGHTVVALRLGTPVTRIVIFLLGGVSELEHEPTRPRDEFLIGAAGPAVSLLLAAAAGAGDAVTGDHTIGGVLLVLLTWSNLVVAAFNLLPGLPLDGGRLLRAAVWALARSRMTGTRVGAWCGRVVAVAVVLAGALLVHERWSVTSLTITLVLAAYLWTGAGESERAARRLERLPGADPVATAGATRAPL